MTQYRIDGERVVKRGKVDGLEYSAVMRWGKLFYTFDDGLTWSSDKRHALLTRRETNWQKPQE